jgi:hypothetical protein
LIIASIIIVDRVIEIPSASCYQNRDHGNSPSLFTCIPSLPTKEKNSNDREVIWEWKKGGEHLEKPKAKRRRLKRSMN